MAIQVDLLTGQHDRTNFECGEPSLNEWLGRMALQQQEKNYARTRVAVDADAPTKILAYYTLLAREVDTAQMPVARKLPQRLACVLLGRLAVDQSAQGRGLGRLMLLDAIARTRTTIEESAWWSMHCTSVPPRSIVASGSRRSRTIRCACFCESIGLEMGRDVNGQES
jgi:GNAT superfamily N-acetyltransferase